ncbi:hypothetical protein [Prevotella sp. HUN102]|uniref:hypothetical protein n=1 Tax=Prevotella sp. HUN102 TaxID=1392486 RepID=UPI0005654B4D|nr:hypothetical protein [Prevotella sp. HUN102]
MKKYILISLLLILNPLNGFTQETHIIEPAELEVIYSTQENFRWDKYALRCGRNTSQYFSISRLGFLKMMASKDDVAVLADMKQSLEDLNITDPRKKKRH